MLLLIAIAVLKESTGKGESLKVAEAVAEELWRLADDKAVDVMPTPGTTPILVLPTPTSTALLRVAELDTVCNMLVVEIRSAAVDCNEDIDKGLIVTGEDEVMGGTTKEL